MWMILCALKEKGRCSSCFLIRLRVEVDSHRYVKCNSLNSHESVES